MNVNRDNVTYYKDQNGNTCFRLANITSFFCEGMRFYSGEQIPPFWFYIPVCLRLQGALDEQKMQDALQKLILHNHALRMNLVKSPARDGYLFRIMNHLDVQIETELLPSEDPEENFAAAKAAVADIIYREHDLEQELFFDFHLWKLGEQDYFLALLFNHSVIDGQSIGLIMKQLTACYAGQETESLWGEAEFMDFYLEQAASRTEETEQNCIAYWKNEFADLPLLDVSGKTGSASYTESDFYLTLDYQKIKNFCRKSGVTVSSAIITAVHYAETAMFGERDTALTYFVANRNKFAYFATVGPFVEPLSHRLRIDENDSYQKILKKTGKKISENIRYQNTWNENVGAARFMLTFMNQGGVEMGSAQGDGLTESSLFSGLKTVMWQAPMLVNWDLYFFVMFITETNDSLELGFATNTKYMSAEDLAAFKFYITKCINDMIADVSGTVTF